MKSDSAWSSYPEGFSDNPLVLFTGFDRPGSVPGDQTSLAMEEDCNRNWGSFIAYNDLEGSLARVGADQFRSAWSADRCRSDELVISEQLKNPPSGQEYRYRLAVRVQTRDA